ncbi:Lrp/AsnC family transcriptional regulator [Thalassospira sp. MBR-102]|jgi:Lrp/AsnC family transcriptional regulator|uniref:AsnC family transcriptional regulator n=3 Tax=Thalassospira TaxID=168934 RepID=A0ABR4TSR7_9PROT|nr:MULTISPECIES: Lrp/AsnC family transcriptional regulator [Thalassospira]KEO58923.1 AsnC family transcriptional regulator [Thalassospira permensis NBRC 106175]MBL4842650.1 Lrp/AsnC family transcriptional regulator [Thalassospira sp.]MCD1592733.1 Lrp/AsnC family transcriptional regulator [Thalassospira xiamenensis]MDM7974987.1 Lrp/AsnC family transcriptional regulator [Thalassospira xiamenensis]SIS56113.1 transcriptional regulator, AsnC family [Thalassospira xiamenensis M-5 = DSM 17429]|tara:strand:+ start:2743 stop:3243 length:501 start_codon:yes stop_codon:yes gene_type:complete
MGFLQFQGAIAGFMADAIDLKILAKLQKDCTQSLESLSDSVGLSPTSCYRRIKKLESDGVIRARCAILDEKKLGFQVTAMFLIKLEKDSADIDQRMQQILKNRPEIQHCYLIAGDFDFVMIAKFRDATEYTDYIYHFLETYADIPIQTYTSKLVVRTVRQDWALPL